VSSGSPVRKATLADVPRLAQALASAFQDDPVITWVLPDAQRRRVVLPVFMEFRLRKLAFPHDEIWMIQDGAASAAWVPPPGIWQMSLAQRVRLLLPMIGFLRLRTPTVLGGLGRMEACHPHEPPHWYLFIIGCERAAQGRGLGSGLLSDMLNASIVEGFLPTLSPRTSATSTCTFATAFGSRARSPFQAAQRSGPCGASPALEQ